MSRDKKARYIRTVNPGKWQSSLFLFGPRMTGKSYLLRQVGGVAQYIDLLDPETEARFRPHVRLFWELIAALPDESRVIVDEVQRIPALLDYVQMGIEQKGIQFLLSGSSVRKLKRGSANLLGGRTLDFKLHPLTCEELGADFSIARALHFGTLPRICQLIRHESIQEARLILKSYYTTYLKEEIQAEALVRNLGAFERFLLVAAQANGTIIEYANIARDCAVPDNTVKEYFSILEDTLLGSFLPHWNARERKKSRSKFYFFDCGVLRGIQNRLIDPPLPRELGLLFETFMVRELHRLRDNHQLEHTFSFWRERDFEVDILVQDYRGIALAIEVKSSEGSFNTAPLKAFRNRFPEVPLVVASLVDTAPRLVDGWIEVLPWRDVLERYLAL